MPRIRTIKPELFRHEGLQDLEINHPGAYAMLVFIALFGHADASGVFPWQPRQLKLDVLPFVPFDMAVTLDILRAAGFIEQYEVAGKQYGIIPTFKKHQRLSGKEASNGERYPLPGQGSIGEAPKKFQEIPGSDREILEFQELGSRNLELGSRKEELGTGKEGPGENLKPSALFSSESQNRAAIPLFPANESEGDDVPAEDDIPVLTLPCTFGTFVITRGSFPEIQEKYPNIDLEATIAEIQEHHRQHPQEYQDAHEAKAAVHLWFDTANKHYA